MMSELTIDLPKEEFEDRVVEEAARQMLKRYTMDEDGSEVTVSTELARRIEREVESTIREQAREAAPVVAQTMLEEGVQQTDTYGYAKGEKKPLKVVVAEEVEKTLRHPNGRSGKGVLDKLIRDEVQRQLSGELKEEIDKAKAVVAKAVADEAVGALQDAVRKALPDVQF